MKKIFLALIVCFMIAGAGYCSPQKPKPHTTTIISASPRSHHSAQLPPQKIGRHKHHHPRPHYVGYPYYGTSITVRANGVSFNYGIGGGSGLNTYW